MKLSEIRKRSFLFASILFCVVTASAQVKVEVNVDMNHQVGGITSFDRSKWMNVHSSQSSSVWTGVESKLDYLINDLDTYFGRETGHIKTAAKTVNQDPNRSGYADPGQIARRGDDDIANYASLTGRHQYEKGKFVVANQQLPLYPNNSNPTDGGWYYSDTDTNSEPFGTASGEFCAEYFNNYFGSGGTSGFPMPEYFEIMNEPVWHFVDGDHDGGGTIDKIFKFHKTVADVIHDKVPNLKVGGYCTAFPDFDAGGNLAQWGERWRVFIRDYGSAFDFYSIHLYDRPIESGEVIEQFRKGGRNEATLDMMEHYSMLHYNKVKPLLITEYGGQLWGMTNEEKLWRPHNDWRRIEAFNAMLMQFLERPNTIAGAIPFVMPKAEWGYDEVNDVPYRCRLLRRANEPESYTGEWVWTEYIKFFELWSEVKGKRVDTFADNLDFQADAYVYGKEMYVILNNIEAATHDFNLDVKGFGNRKIESVKVKRLNFTSDEQVKLTTNTYSSFTGTQQIRDDETIILKYTFDDVIDVNQTSEETKYYATEYKKSIKADTPVEFTFNNISKGSNGEAVVRFGLARALSSKRFPHTIRVNGTKVDIPTNYRGDRQRGRKQFFGMLELGVPNSLLNSGTNTVSISFADSDGFISSCALQVFEFSRALTRFETTSGGDNSTDATFYIVNNETGKKIRHKDTIDGDQIQLVPSSWNSTRQQFTKIDTDNGYFYLKNVESGMYFRPTDDTDGSALIQRPTSYDGSYTQWRQVTASGDYFYLQNRSTGMYFRPETDADYSSITQRPTSSNGTWTQWKFIDVNTGETLKSVIKEESTLVQNTALLYPNPAKNKLMLSGISEGIYNLTIYKVDGQLIKQYNVNVSGEDIDINISNLSNGIYLLKVQNNEMKTILRFVKE